MIRQKQSFEKLNTFQSLNLRLYISPTWKGQKSRTFLPHAGYQSYHMDIAECHNVLLNVSCPIRSETSQSLQCFSAGLWPPEISDKKRCKRAAKSSCQACIKSEFSSFRVVFAFSPNLSKFPSSHKKKRLVPWLYHHVSKKRYLVWGKSTSPMKVSRTLFFLGSKQNSCPWTKLDTHKNLNDDAV